MTLRIRETTPKPAGRLCRQAAVRWAMEGVNTNVRTRPTDRSAAATQSTDCATTPLRALVSRRPKLSSTVPHPARQSRILIVCPASREISRPAFLEKRNILSDFSVSGLENAMHLAVFLL